MVVLRPKTPFKGFTDLQKRDSTLQKFLNTMRTHIELLLRYIPSERLNPTIKDLIHKARHTYSSDYIDEYDIRTVIECIEAQERCVDCLKELLPEHMLTKDINLIDESLKSQTRILNDIRKHEKSMRDVLSLEELDQIEAWFFESQTTCV